MTILYKQPFAFIRASRYANPGTPGDILGEVYGDFSTGGIAGAVPAVQIDTVARVYAAAAHAVGSITKVYVGEVESTIGVDCTVNVSTDYAGTGLTIAIIDFVTQPTQAVTWRGTGKQSGGSTITNGITQLENILTTRASAVASDFNAAMLEEARSAVALQGYQTSWVFRDARNVETWINEVMFNLLGAWYVRGNSELALSIQTSTGPRGDQILAHIVASRDVVDGDFGVEMSGDIEHVVNALDIDYLWNWALDSRSSVITTEADDISRNAHGEIRKLATLRGHRRTVDLTAWAAILFQYQSMRTRVEGAVVRFTVEGPKLAHATIGDFVAVSWRYGPTREENNAYTNEICRVVAVRHEITAGGVNTSIEAIDTGTFRAIDVYFDPDVIGGGDFDAENFFGGGRDLTVHA